MDPVKWKPPKAPDLLGVLASNTALAEVQRWPTGGHGPEDIAVDPSGRIYTGVEDGRVLRWSGDGQGPEEFAHTGGKPHGLDADRDGNLIVCDTRRGLLRIDHGGAIEVLCDSFDGAPLRFANNPHVASDGTVYWSDSTTRWGFDDYQGAFFEHSLDGRLFATKDGETRLLLRDLPFPNGVTMDPDETFVLVASTSEYRIDRLWVSGDRAGQREEWATNLPGFPDNLTTSPRGTIWCALANPRDTRLDRLGSFPLVRKLVWNLPDSLRPDETPYAHVVEFDLDGRIVRSLQDPKGNYAKITGVREHDGWLYLASIDQPDLARVRLDPLA